jgi:hypothetical protein
MKKRLIGPAVVALLVALAAAHFWWPASSPAGQKPLLTLSGSNLREFEQDFDANADVPRVVVLLSPT